MKRILFALAALALAVGTSFATTRAVWTDTVTVASNQVVTGTTDLQVSTDNGTSWSTTSMSSALNQTGLIPGPVVNAGYVFSLRNLSSTPLNFTLGGRITPATVIAGAPDKTKLLIQVYDFDTPANATAWQTLADWEAASAGGITFNSTLNNGVAKRFGINVQLDGTADNTWQGRTVTFSIEAMGTQI